MANESNYNNFFFSSFWYITENSSNKSKIASIYFTLLMCCSNKYSNYTMVYFINFTNYFGLLCGTEILSKLIKVCVTNFYLKILNNFFKTYFSRELQRIENITCSPIISHFSETIQGVSTIRAFNQETRFMEILFKRMESNNIAFIILNTSNRWLGIALDYLGGFIVFIAIITALFTTHLYPENSDSSLIGLAINYTLLVPIYLNWVVKLLSDMEMYIGAVERVEYYIESGNHEKNVVCMSILLFFFFYLHFMI